MHSKEIDRAHFFELVKNGNFNLKQVSKHLELSYPQTKRLWAKYKIEGRKGLISKKRGQSNRTISHDKRQEIAKIIATDYFSCGPLFVKEKLCERHGIIYSSEFIRQVMIEYNLWVPKKKKVQIHQRRLRRECQGELVQIDASHHAWFEDRGPKCHLHLLIDDATSKLMGGYFASEETTEGYYRACFSYFEKIGRPLSLYSDKRGTFLVNQGCPRQDTQFARAMKELDIRMITAHSPQAKGRIERAFGTLQERLVWEMRLHHISNIEEANVFLPNFLEAHNKQFSQPASNPSNAHRPLNQKMQLMYILCTKEERTASKNLEVNYNTQIYQLHPPAELKATLKHAKIKVITTLQKELFFEFKGVFIDYSIYNEQEYYPVTIDCIEVLKRWKGRKGYKPPKSHPYKNINKCSFK